MKSDKNIREGYKRTAVGVIPEEWEVKKLGDLCGDICGEYGANKSAIPYSAKMPRYIRITDIDDDGRLHSNSKVSTNLNTEETRKFKLIHHDLLFARTGATVGKSYLHKCDGENNSVYAGFLIRFRICPEKANPIFIKEYTNTSIYWNWVKAYSARSGQPGINSNEYKTLNLPIPPLPQQQAIANCLTTWDKGIETLSALIDAKREQKKGLMQQLLTGKKRLNGFVGEWEEVKLGDIGAFRTSSVNKKIEKDETKVWLLNYMDVYRNTHLTSEIKFQLTSAKDTQIKSSNLEIGDVLFTPSSETPDDIGHSAVVIEKLDNVVFSYHLVRFRPRKNFLDIDFSGYIFNKSEILNEFSRRATGSTRYTLSIKDFNEVETKIPPLKEQTAIAHILTTADKEIALLEKKLEAMKEEKKGLMQVLLTGEKRLMVSG